MKKIIKVILIVVASLVLLATIFGIVDYTRAKNGKKPIFTFLWFSVNTFDVEIVGQENSYSKGGISTIYSGLAYKIITCDFCEKKVSFLPLGIGNYPYTTLTCTKDKESNHYRFIDQKLETITRTLVISDKDIDDVESYEKEFYKIDEIKGCYGTFTKEMNSSGITTYTTSEFCDLNKMSNKDIKIIYGDKVSLSKTQKEVIKEYEDNNPDFKCKKENI